MSKALTTRAGSNEPGWEPHPCSSGQGPCLEGGDRADLRGSHTGMNYFRKDRTL